MIDFKAGDTVRTAYGVGVIVNRNADAYGVRLWRVPGKSIGSSSLAQLQSTAILGKLPAAPGMRTTLKSEADAVPTDKSNNVQVLVHCYYENRNVFVVSRVSAEKSKSPFRRVEGRKEKETTKGAPLEEVLPEQLEEAASSKFYPVLESLMFRAEQAATATNQLLQSDTTKRLIDSGQRVLSKGTERFEKHKATLASSPDKLADITQNVSQKVQDVVPEIEGNVKQVITMVKDEEITVLLGNCKKRLEQLARTDLSEASRNALEKTGIKIDLHGHGSSSFRESMVASRKTALTALNDLLQQAELDNLDKIQTDVSKNFTKAFDSLTTAAKSDRGLNEMFEKVSEKTTEWQQTTGRVMTTRSASLFLEGASRIQARAAAIFNHTEFRQLGEIGSKLTKSFTEGDAALARLKSIELGEAVKARLITAIELRSESKGGLDAIIAGALTTVTTTAEKNGSVASNRIQSIVSDLQRTASSKTTDAHETLLSVLSSRSSYSDLALLRTEQALIDLGHQIGDDVEPDEIAALVRGEGGTAKLFQPIAQKAMKQINKQLDAAESQVQDNETVLQVLSRVRKILSGELTLSAIMDDVVNVLNDDKVVAAGETLVLGGEQVLDAIEGVSANKAVNDALQIAEKAGITKDSVMKEFEKLNVDELLGAAGEAVTDERARRKLLSAATDAALDFILRIIPSMPVPPFEGVKDGLVYKMSNLSMEGFKVKKQNIQIELAGMRATKRRKRGSKKPKVAPNPDSETVSANTEDAHPCIEKTYSSDDSYASGMSGFSTASSELNFEEIHASVKATELLIIDVKNISAVLDNAAWSFEQTYLPYLKGNGEANIKMSGGAIRLQFELRKRRKHELDDVGGELLTLSETEWEPVLCLHDRSCSISDVELSLEGASTLTWVVNKLAAVFKGPLRDYVVSTIISVLSNKSGWILQRLNTVLSPYWDVIMRTAKLHLDDLVEAGDDVVVAEPLAADYTVAELVWRERLPLGMNLLMNDESGALKVVDFPRGSQARGVCEKRGFNPDAFEGASIISVNGTDYYDQDELFDVLKDPSRPKTIRFRLADNEEAERLRKFLDGDLAPVETEEHVRNFSFRKVQFDDRCDIGIEFGSSDDNLCLTVKSFVGGDGGTILAAEKSGDVKIGDLLTHINDEPVIGLGAENDGQLYAIGLLEAAAGIRPLCLTFSDPYLYKMEVVKLSPGPGVDSSGSPKELSLSEKKEGDKRRILVKGFENVNGMAEENGILIGDHVVFINGLPVGAGCRWLGTSPVPLLSEVLDILKDKMNYPISITFARPKQGSGSRWSANFTDADSDTFCVTAESEERIGCVFDESSKTDVIVKDFIAVPGLFQRALTPCKDENGRICVAIDSVNSQFVPSYASVNMICSALNRSWKSNETTELVLCDDDLKKWVLLEA